jgi:hypothetical protein
MHTYIYRLFALVLCLRARVCAVVSPPLLTRAIFMLGYPSHSLDLSSRYFYICDPITWSNSDDA